MDNIKVIITDDKERYRNVLKDLLEPFPITVTGEAEHGKALLDLLEHNRPDIILLDLEMPVMDGNVTFQQVRKKYPQLNMIILSSHFEAELVDDYIERGARGYLPKDCLDNTILANAIFKVHSGGTFVYEKPKSKLNLNDKQKVLMPLVFNNYNNQEIADIMDVSPATVQKEKLSLYEKSGVTNAIDFYKWAFTKGLQFLGIRKKKK